MYKHKTLFMVLIMLIKIHLIIGLQKKIHLIIG